MNDRHRHRDKWYPCPACGKRAFPTRKAARRAAFDGMSPYPCERLEDMTGNRVWHYGHLAQDIRRGNADRNTYYGPDGIGRIRSRYGNWRGLDTA